MTVKDKIENDVKIHERIMQEAFLENAMNKPVSDGPVDPNQFYNTTKTRTVIIAQEPYGDTGNWNLAKSLSDKKSLREQDKSGLPTFRGEVKLTNQVNKTDFDPMSDEAYELFKETAAHINVKKEPNGSSKSKIKDIKRHADANALILQDQLSNMDLKSDELIVLAGTKKALIKDHGDSVEILGRKIDKKHSYTTKKGRHEYTVYDDGKGPVIIAAPHPAAERYGKGKWADNIMEAQNDIHERPSNLSLKEIGQNDAFIDNHMVSQPGGNKFINSASSTCRDVIDYIKKNPKTVIVSLAAIIVLITGIFYLYKRYRKRRKR